MATLQGGAAYYIMPDHLGAPHEIVNSANGRVWFWDHDPYGNGAPSAAAGFSHDLRFPGQIYDAETRLHNNGFRDYDPRLGRYVESDPIGLAGGINTYVYAGNDPVNAIDPLGLDPESKEKREALPDIDVAAVAARCVTMCHGSDPGYRRPATDRELAPLYALTFLATLPVGGGWLGLGRVGISGAVASNAANALRLSKALASEAQMGEAGVIIAGQGAKKVFRNAATVAKDYGGNAADWVKKASSSFTAKDGTQFETHWVENLRTGQRVEYKTKFGEE